jgi:hypothetical protein
LVVIAMRCAYVERASSALAVLVGASLGLLRRRFHPHSTVMARWLTTTLLGAAS